jgi:hypothetical protein
LEEVYLRYGGRPEQEKMEEVMNTPVDEQISRWNVIKKQYKKLSMSL